MPLPGALKALVLTADVTKTRSPQMIGDDQPRPGRSAVHATCSVVDHDTGSVASSAMPAPLGPRNCGHPGGLAACNPGTEAMARARTTPARARLAGMRMAASYRRWNAGGGAFVTRPCRSPLPVNLCRLCP